MSLDILTTTNEPRRKCKRLDFMDPQILHPVSVNAGNLSSGISDDLVQRKGLAAESAMMNSKSSGHCTLAMTNPKTHRGPGRPATARRIWADPKMQKRLVRLYLYTAEGSLSTKQMCRLITELAQRSEKLKSPGNFLESAPKSEIRSMQYQLKRLLPGRYHELRPRNRELARARMGNLQLIRNRRLEKSRNRRKTGRQLGLSFQAYDGGSAVSNQSLGGISKPGSDVEFRSKQSADERVLSWSSINSSGSRSSDGTNDRHIRASLIREILARAGGKRPSSSIILEIRSLLSSSSRRSSRISQKSFTTALPTDLASQFPDEQDFTRRNKLVIEFCCQHRLDCLHRRASRLLNNSDSTAIISDSILQEGLTRDDRDMWNSTILHLLARWATDMSVVVLLFNIAKRCEASMINARNINGDTFLHIFARRWSESENTPESGLLINLIHIVSSRGFRFDVWNTRGYNVFASFVPESLMGPTPSGFPTSLHRKVVHILHSLFDVPDGGRFLRESLTAPSSRPDDDPVSMLLWSQTAYNEFIDDEIRIRDETRDRFQDWRLAGHTTIYAKLPSLHLCLAHDAAEAVELLDRGADVDEYNEEGKTALMILLEKSHLKEAMADSLAHTLLDRGARVDLLDRDGNSVLHYAVNSRFPDVLQRLIKAGADINAKNIRSETCIDIAIKNYNLARYSPSRLWRGNNAYSIAQVMLVHLIDANPGSGWEEGHGLSLPGIQE